jgi:hypothetical protein
MPCWQGVLTEMQEKVDEEQEKEERREERRETAAKKREQEEKKAVILLVPAIPPAPAPLDARASLAAPFFSTMFPC